MPNNMQTGDWRIMLNYKQPPLGYCMMFMAEITDV